MDTSRKPAKPKIPFKRHALPPPTPVVYTPPPTKPEGTDIRNKGYFPGSGYTPEELAWIKAVERFQKETGRKFLSHVDYYRLAVGLVPGLRIAVTAPKLAEAAEAKPPTPRAKRAAEPIGRTLFDDLPD